MPQEHQSQPEPTQEAAETGAYIMEDRNCSDCREHEINGGYCQGDAENLTCSCFDFAGFRPITELETCPE